MLSPINPQETPPGGWRWRHPETGYLVHSSTATGLISAARAFLHENNYPVPADLEQRIWQWMNEDVQRDMEKRGLPPFVFLHNTEPPTLLDRARSFAWAAKDWMRSGMPVTTHDVVQSRLETCRTCGYWSGESSPFHTACRKCGCTGIKMWMATSRCPIGKW